MTFLSKNDFYSTTTCRSEYRSLIIFMLHNFHALIKIMQHEIIKYKKLCSIKIFKYRHSYDIVPALIRHRTGTNYDMEDISMTILE